MNKDEILALTFSFLGAVCFILWLVIILFALLQNISTADKIIECAGNLKAEIGTADIQEGMWYEPNTTPEEFRACVANI